MSGLTALECPHPGVEHIHTISVPLHRATLVLCLLYTSLVHLLLYYVLPVHVVRWCTVPVAILVDDAAEILRVIRIVMAIMVKWRSRLHRERVEDGKL